MLACMTQPPDTKTIPSDLATCQTLLKERTGLLNEQTCLVETQSHTIDELHGKSKQLQLEIKTLKQEQEEFKLQIKLLIERAFARRSERYLSDPNQLLIDFGDDAADAAEGLAEAIDEADLNEQQTVVPAHVRRKKKKRRDEGLPKHLPRYEVEAPVSDEQKHCPEHGERKVIGYDRVETLQFERPKLRVRVTKYPKYACENQPQCGVGSPERPTGLVEGDRYDASIAAEIITNKYGYHLPVYRQQDQFAGSGWTPSRSTLLNILKASAFVLRPLCEHIKQTILATDVLGTDDTSVTLLVPRRENIPLPTPGDLKSEWAYEKMCEAVEQGKPSVAAKMWAYRSVTIPLTFFDFTVSRKRAGPDLVLANFQGKLMADCYAGYQGLELRTNGRILRGACAAHARRKVYESRDVYPKESSIVLAKFQQLYDIEDRGKNLSSDERLALRQDESQAVWCALGQWLDSSAAKDILPKSRFGQALGYLRNQWDALQLYLTDGRMPIDNNDVEQLMKQVALGRKNWLFIGSTAAGDRAADFMTLVASAIRNDLDVWAYLKDVLDRLLAGETNYEPLRCDIWRQSHPEFIRQYRARERRDKADRKQARRAARRQNANA